MTRTDRSRHLELLRCPRARYLGYHLGGTGITLAGTRPSIYLVQGLAEHAGFESLLTGHDVEDAVTATLKQFWDSTEGIKGFQLQPDEHLSFTLTEQANLAEILVRIYAAKALPLLLAEYEVVGVEQEYEWPLGGNGEIIFMSRLDALLRRRLDGDLVTLSYKTDSGYDPISKLADHQQDLQGITENWAVAASPRLTGGNQDSPNPHFAAAPPSGVKMEFLVKGKWKVDKDRPGMRIQDTFLVHPWAPAAAPWDSSKWKWSYFWTCQDAHIAVASNGRKTACPGGKTHGAGSTYERFNIWERMTPKEWVDLLLSGECQPEAGDPFKDCLFLPPSLIRTPAEMRDRISQVTSLERAASKGVEELGQLGPGDDPKVFEWRMNQLFPQNTATCNQHFGGPCQFHRMCWPYGKFAWALEHTEDLGYTPRKPHHAGELIQIGGTK